MSANTRQFGFSLIETLLAVSTLAIGMVFVAGTFLAGVYFATVSTERTIGTIVTDEALAKIALYGMDPNDPNMTTGGFVPFEYVRNIAPTEFFYPSTSNATTGLYSWAALCKRAGPGSRLVDITVFVSRQSGSNVRYWVRGRGSLALQPTDWPLPRPVRVNVFPVSGGAADELTIKDAVPADGIDERAFLDDGAVLVDDATGQIYRVLQRYPATPDRIKLDRAWAGGTATTTDGAWVWTMPRPISGGRSPYVAIYQKVVRF